MDSDNEDNQERRPEHPSKRICVRAEAAVDQIAELRATFATEVEALKHGLAKISMEKAMLLASSARVEAMINQINTVTPSLIKSVDLLIQQSQLISAQVGQGIRPLSNGTIAKLVMLQVQLSKKEQLVQELRDKLELHATTINELQAAFTKDTDVEVKARREMERTVDAMLLSIDANMTCAICLSDWSKVGEHRVVSLPCAHLFGEECAYASLLAYQHCPMCRSPCTTADIKRVYKDVGEPNRTFPKLFL
ncbi:hypothetical protein AWZ03_012522 [Drosophila navojoa]|uniref:RING-type domain-containing protein n=1 Tax=Drosophila navojoa TaxID=7232 RepID=A0A484AZP4_DRONA|nr:uncharacterized protein LOC108655841 [Drosophila navojoa]TDG41055.1 hypothetical protein AWZ03_012522 [Drosophila navojoa]